MLSKKNAVIDKTQIKSSNNFRLIQTQCKTNKTTNNFANEQNYRKLKKSFQIVNYI